MDLYAPAVVSLMKLVWMLDDVKVVRDSVLLQNIAFWFVGLIKESTVQYTGLFVAWFGDFFFPQITW